ncbi:MAG: LCP family protein, partial [Thermocrispum sp.]
AKPAGRPPLGPRPADAPPKPLVRKRPPKATVAQTTVTQRLWRNEPTELIPVVGDDKPPPQPPDEPAPSTRLQQKRVRKDHRAVLLAKSTVAAVAVLIFLATGGAWGVKEWYNSKFVEIAALDEESTDIKHKAAQLGDENFLILGSDTRAGAPKGAGIGTEKTIKGARSDTLMIAHLPKDRKRAVIVSFPRDLEITRPECQRWNYKTGEYSEELMPETPQVKLNTAYAEGGPKCVIKWVQRQTGMRMNHFVGIDFGGFKGMVDAVGGVQVKVDKPIVDSILGTVVEKPGTTTLTGDRALSFVRARHVSGDPTSDYGRIKRQQQFIAALLAKTMSREVLLDPGKVTGFVNAFAASTFGDNVGVDDMLELASSLKGMNADKVKFLTVPTTGYANDRGNEVLLADQAGELFSAIIHNKAIPGLADEQGDSGTPEESSSNEQGEARQTENP